MVDQRKLAIGVGNHFAQVFVRQFSHARIGLADFPMFGGDFGFQCRLVPPRTSFEIAFAVFRQVDIFGPVQRCPGFGAIKRMVRVGKRNP